MDDDFSYDGKTYEINSVEVLSEGTLRFNTGLAPTPNMKSTLTLLVDGQAFDFARRDGLNVGNMYWRNSGLNWSEGDRVSLSLTDEGSVEDLAAPELDGASVSGAELLLDFSEVMDLDALPEPSAFTVTVGDGERDVASVSAAERESSGGRVVVVRESHVVLTLASAVRAGDTVTVSYTTPGTNPLRDRAGNSAPAFEDAAVENRTAAVKPDAPASLEAEAGDGTVTLSWTHPTRDGGAPLTNYQMRRKALLQKSDSIPNALPPDRLGDGQKRLHLPI